MNNNKTRIAPSLIPAADLANITSEIERISDCVDMLHVDVMDGHFVPNLTIGPPVIGYMRKQTSLFFDTHLMISNPGKYLDDFRRAGCDSLTVHFEAGDTLALVKEIKSMGMKAGVAINPATGADVLIDLLPHLDMVTVMTVEPGFGGQSFMRDMVSKIKYVADAIESKKLQVSVEVDGGVGLETAMICAEAGADTFVAGNAVFGAPDPQHAIASLTEVIEKVRFART